ncbi:MAG: hypothetical protein ACTSWD_12645 [Candidatus Heimdallarchaeota archaeon]
MNWTKIRKYIILNFVLALIISCASESLTSAKLYLQRGDLDNAEIYLVKALKIEPDNPEVPYLLGEFIYGPKGEYENMDEMFVKAMELGPDRVILNGGRVRDYVAQSRRKYEDLLILNEVKIINDEFEPTINVYGIEQTIEGSLNNKYFIRSFINKQNKNTKHQIYVRYSYEGDWHFYYRANAKGGDAVKFIEIGRDVDCRSSSSCTYYETFGAIIPQEFLKDNISGFSIKFSAKSGDSFVVKISSFQINEQLEAIESIQ